MKKIIKKITKRDLALTMSVGGFIIFLMSFNYEISIKTRMVFFGISLIGVLLFLLDVDELLGRKKAPKIVDATNMSASEIFQKSSDDEEYKQEVN